MCVTKPSGTVFSLYFFLFFVFALQYEKDEIVECYYQDEKDEGWFFAQIENLGRHEISIRWEMYCEDVELIDPQYVRVSLEHGQLIKGNDGWWVEREKDQENFKIMDHPELKHGGYIVFKRFGIAALGNSYAKLYNYIQVRKKVHFLFRDVKNLVSVVMRFKNK